MGKSSLLSWTIVIVLAALVGVWLISSLQPVEAQTDNTTLRVSIGPNGAELNARSGGARISPDGQFAAFTSWAINLVEDDTNFVYNLFVHNFELGETTHISKAVDNSSANGDSGGATFSSDGQYIAFYSEATNLVSDDINGWRDVFVHDQQTGETTLVSVSSDGTQGDYNSWVPSLSADGRFVAFESGATTLARNERGLFVHDRQTRETALVSVASDGTPANDLSIRPFISANGRFVAFLSRASNLSPSDTNGQLDVFVHDRVTGETERVSVASDGTQADYEAGDPAISADGRFVTFASKASNLVPGDTNNFCPIEGASSANCLDVFVHDRETGETERVSVASAGTQGNGDSGPYWTPPAISADGRFVAFWSWADNLVPDDTNQQGDVFRHDRLTGETIRVSVAADGSQSHPRSFSPVVSISADGQRIAFNSDAADLVPNDTNGAEDVFVRILSDVPSAISLTNPSTTGQRDPVWLLGMLAGGTLLLLALRGRGTHKPKHTHQPTSNE